MRRIRSVSLQNAVVLSRSASSALKTAEMYEEKYRASLERLLARSAPSNPRSFFQAVDRLRDTHDQLLVKNPYLLNSEREAAMRAGMEQAIAAVQVEASEVTSTRQTGQHVTVGSKAAVFGGLVLSTIAVILLYLALVAAGWISIAIGPSAEQSTVFSERLVRERIHVSNAVTALNEIEQEVRHRQQDDPEGLAAVAGERQLALRLIDEDLSARVLAGYPRGTAVPVRANELGYKVLFNWTLCWVAFLERPDLVDRARSCDEFVCAAFGKWN